MWVKLYHCQLDWVSFCLTVKLISSPLWYSVFSLMYWYISPLWSRSDALGSVLCAYINVKLYLSCQHYMLYLAKINKYQWLQNNFSLWKVCLHPFVFPVFLSWMTGTHPNDILPKSSLQVLSKINKHNLNFWISAGN